MPIRHPPDNPCGAVRSSMRSPPDARPIRRQPSWCHTAALDRAGDLAALLADSERETRARLYRTLDLVLQLDHVQETLEARLQLCGGGGRI